MKEMKQRVAAINCRFAALFVAVLLTAGPVHGAPKVPQAADTLYVYPEPKAVLYRLHNDDFTVRVRTPGGEWQDLFEYRIRVDMDAPQNASLVYFDFNGTVEVEVEKNNGRFDEVRVAPASSVIKLRRTGSIVRFTLSHPESFSLQFDDDRLHNLHILAGAPPTPAPQGDHVRIFEPGYHTPPQDGDTFPVQSGDRIYLSGGAVLAGAFDLTGLHDVKIMGRGLLYDPGRPIDLNQSDDVEISDLILVNTERKAAARVMNIRNSSRIQVRNISGFTAGKWSDGLNISTSQHVSVEGGYLRVSDDAVVVYAVTDCPICGDKPIAPVGPLGSASPADTFDIKISNLRIWNDVAHSLFVGHFGDNATPRSIYDVSFDNIDIANLDEDDPAWEGAMAIFSGDSTLTRNITFSNIRVDRIEEGKLINIVAGNNGQYNKMPGRGIENVTFRNISFSGEGLPGRSIISGQSPQSAVKNVSFENLRIGGRLVRSAQDANISVGANVEGLSFR